MQDQRDKALIWYHLHGVSILCGHLDKCWYHTTGNTQQEGVTRAGKRQRDPLGKWEKNKALGASSHGDSKSMA